MVFINDSDLMSLLQLQSEESAGIVSAPADNSAVEMATPENEQCSNVEIEKTTVDEVEEAAPEQVESEPVTAASDEQISPVETETIPFTLETETMPCNGEAKESVTETVAVAKVSTTNDSPSKPSRDARVSTLATISSLLCRMIIVLRGFSRH
jgi:hypothetical protein